MRVLVGCENCDAGRVSRSELSAVAHGYRQLRVVDLRVGLAPQLPCGFDQQIDTAFAGVVDDRPPPSVLIASLRGSSNTRCPCATNSPPSPFVQKPRSSIMHMTVMENESYAISTSISPGVTPASANALGPDCAPALTVMSPPFSGTWSPRRRQ